MSRGINRVTLVGNLGNVPELRYSQGGTAHASVGVATSEAWKDKDGNKQERTEWHRVKFFGKVAEVAGKMLKKGDCIFVEGSLRTDKYTDKHGVERYATYVVADQLLMLGSRQPAPAVG